MKNQQNRQIIGNTQILTFKVRHIVVPAYLSGATIASNDFLRRLG